MNDTILMNELSDLAAGKTAQAFFVQQRAKEALSDVRRAQTLLRKARTRLAWCKLNAHKSAQQIADERQW